MRTVGKEVFIQRGETWSLDFEVKNEKGDPYMILNEWKNPFLAITVTAARYEQKGDFRKTWWLDLSQRWIEQEDGSMILDKMPTFIATEALYVQYLSLLQVLATYGTDAQPSGRIVLDKNSPFDITNFLFFMDQTVDNKRVYKRLVDYNYKARGFVSLIPALGLITREWKGRDDNYDIITYYPGDLVYYEEQGYRCKVVHTSETPFLDVPDMWEKLVGFWQEEEVVFEKWEDYSFRIVKAFDTRDWTEQNYLFDAKVLSGETVEDGLKIYLLNQGISNIPNDIEECLTLITSRKDRKYFTELIESGIPLMPTFDTKTLILSPTKLTVSANIQGVY